MGVFPKSLLASYLHRNPHIAPGPLISQGGSEHCQPTLVHARLPVECLSEEMTSCTNTLPSMDVWLGSC